MISKTIGFRGLAYFQTHPVGIGGTPAEGQHIFEGSNGTVGTGLGELFFVDFWLLDIGHKYSIQPDYGYWTQERASHQYFILPNV